MTSSLIRLVGTVGSTDGNEFHEMRLKMNVFFVFAWRCLSSKAELAPPNWRTVDKGRASDRLSRLLTETWDVVKKVWFIRKTRCAFSISS